MKKKQLSRRQLSRIRHLQQQHKQRAADGPEPSVGDEPRALGPEQQGLVICHFGQQLEIEALEGEHKGQVLRCHQRANLEALVAGDRVIWQAGEPYGVVVACQPRRSLLKRPTGMGELKPVAANIDTLVVVIAPLPEPFPNLIDRYLVAAENIPVQTLLVLNKQDLLQAEQAEDMGALLQLYERIGYPTLRVSAKSGEGLDALRQFLKQRTSIFAGQSGVGKSALVNALMPGVDTLEGSLSSAMDKGRHTTTAARLFHFPEGGDLIDSPGIREFGLSHMEDAALLQGFVDFRPYLGHCRFRDCRHQQEPGCRLLQAVEEGKVDPRRLESYRLIAQSLANPTSPA